MERTEAPSMGTLFKKFLFNRNLLLGSLVPLAAYVILGRLLPGLWPAIVCMAYSALYLAIQLAVTRKIDFFGAVSLVVLAISFAGMLLSNDERFFLFRNTIDEIVLFAIFAATMFMKRPMIQIIVESVTRFDPGLQALDVYRRTWRIETLVWIAYYAAWFAAQALLYFALEKEAFLAVQVLGGRLSFVGLLGFSFWYSLRKFAAPRAQAEGCAD